MSRCYQWSLEADNKHVEIMLREWGMTDCKPLENPVARDNEETQPNDTPMTASDATKTNNVQPSSFACYGND